MAGLQSKFIHHVFFWLRRPESADDLRALIAGLQKLSKAGTIAQFHIGRPAATSREVIDRSYSISWFVLFDGADDQDNYQRDPIHLEFIDQCSTLWSRVLVYDSVDA